MTSVQEAPLDCSENCNNIKKAYLKALEDVEYFRKTLEIYKYDKLTGLMMRHDFEYEYLRKFRVGKPFSLTLVDANDLKSVNKEQGYAAGDELISLVAKHLSERNNTVYRIGGDEFAIVSENKTITISDEIKEKVTVQTVEYAKHFISPGQMFDTADRLVRNAKEILYRKKCRRGK